MSLTINVMSETSPIQWIFICSQWSLMIWCFSARASAMTMLSTHTCVSRCLWVKASTSVLESHHYHIFTAKFFKRVNMNISKVRKFPAWIFINNNGINTTKLKQQNRTQIWEPGDWINIKMPSYQYRKSHCEIRPSYLHNGIILYW